ncbi:transposable element Tcb1 transposase [Trichonephila clavipes]|nr:transposable element Tcb1 transposase [Trichonephila clavipes]
MARIVRHNDESVREGYIRNGGKEVKLFTQCFNCNNFFHTAQNCHLKPRCLKCRKEHPTRQCSIKERQETPFCINCQEYGHSACYTKCPKFPKPKKDTPLTANKTFESNVRVGKVSLSLTLLAEPHPLHPTPVHQLTEKTNENSNNKVSHGIQAIENEYSDLAQVIELVSMISNIIKRSPDILQLLPKLKNSEDDKAKALLLFEANTGRPRVTTPNKDRYLAVTAKRNRRSTASDLFRQLSSATGTTVSRQTVYRRLGHIGLYSRWPVRCVPLTATHCRLRLTWSRKHAL